MKKQKNTPPSHSATSLGAVFCGIVLALLAGIACGGSLGNDFVFYDDDVYVTSNWYVRQGLGLEGIQYAFTTSDSSNWIPLTWLSLQLDTTLWGGAAWGYHLSNVLLHIANTVLLWVWLRGATGNSRAAFAVAAFWSVHPLHVESVAWISERKNVLSTLFLLLTLISWTHYCARPSLKKYGLTLGLMTLGLLAKSMLVSVPFLLLLGNVWPLKRSAAVGAAQPQTRTPWRSLLLEQVPFLFVVLAISLVTIFVQQEAMTGMTGLPLSMRLGNAVRSYGCYVVQTFLPTGLMPIYPHPFEHLNWNEVLLSGAALAVSGGLVITLRKNHPWLLFGWLWYGVTLLPVCGLLQVGLQAHADRYAYVPQMGLLIALVWEAMFWLQKHERGMWYGGLLALPLLTVSVMLTRIQVSNWVNTPSLWKYTLSVDPENWVAYYEVGRMNSALEDWQNAALNYEQALRRAPYHLRSLVSLGTAREHLGDPSGAARAYEAALLLNPSEAFVKERLEVIRAEGSQPGVPDR